MMTFMQTFTTLPNFIWLAFFTGLLIALAAAPLGVFVVWQRQSYFGATIAHSALLGVAIALLMQWNLTLSVIIVAILIALSIHWLNHHTQLSSDTLLGILAHSGLAVGLILISLADTIQVDVMSFLFGDILTVSEQDLGLIALTTLIVLAFFIKHWQDLLNITLNPSLAEVEGVAVKRVQLYFTLLLAVLIALSMKIVGILLITALLIIPAAAARPFSRSPEQMLKFTLLISLLSLFIGMASAFYWDLPTGPAIVFAASVLFLLTQFKNLRNSKA
ncbi:zinc ABC transporter permease subunit ZnuB [Galenea microaerophila]